ncbi:hypothetical protein FNAPI_9294 [Fusarium napiforme]|uniref:2EXR domain-containing protein n=1 Tax=Fusarium napiforme TaxID=42672 RepID=A0A8H5MYF8_9HYPO|nr:hypothetical protein FNAPI_9294 [Fusarium napiforme]
MFQLVKKLFKCQNHNSDNEPKGAFHRFCQLPQEIQNLIWSYALCVDAPRAYFVDVRKLSDNPRILEMAHSIPASLGRFPPPPASNRKGDYNLMRVCRASYQEICRCWTFYRPQVPARMILDNSHDNAPRAKKLSSIDIDAASDLVIVERWCHGGGRPAQLVRYKWRHIEMPACLVAQPRPGDEVFRARGRIFYEISARDMKDAGIDPEDYVEPWLRKRWRWQRWQRRGIPYIKFITWQWIQ